MTRLPEVKWMPLLIPNPDRRWWQLWKLRLIPNPDVLPLPRKNNRILNDIPWKGLHND